MIFVDASALVAILAREAGSPELMSALDTHTRRFYSAMSHWETVAALCKSHRFAIDDARAGVALFLSDFDFEMVTIGAVEADLAIEAYQTYGRGRHPASLNMGDCFAYACAKSIGARLLYKGEDLARTDLAWSDDVR